MMFHKALLFNDSEVADQILAELESPLKCKKLGRKVQGFDDAISKENAQAIVEQGVFLKISQNHDIAEFLMSLQKC